MGSILGLKTVLIAGAGTMGRGIAELMAACQFEVQLWDRSPRALGRSSSMIERSLRRQYKVGRIGSHELDQTLSRIRLISDLKVVNQSTEVAIEAVTEDAAIKVGLLQRLEQTLPDAWLVTQTSSLSVAKIAAKLKAPHKLIGMHFFNPAPIAPLVEIIYGDQTDKIWVRRATEFVERALKKKTVVLKDSPGFVSTRLDTIVALEAMRLVEQEVSSAADIDRVMELGFRYPMGPLRYSDWVGLDVRLKTATALYAETNDLIFKPPAILERMVAEGKLGLKSGEGFYMWPALESQDAA